MFFVALFFFSCSLLSGAIIWKQRKIIATLLERRKDILVEEHRMFSFLHALGETLQTSQTQGELYEFIIQGTTRVVNAKGGALYLANEGQSILLPEALTGDCPALFIVDDELLEDEAKFRSFLKLKTLPIDDTTLLGMCMLRRKGLHLNNLWEHPLWRDHAGAPGRRPALSGMMAPLFFGERNLGVLAVVGGSERFSTNDFAVFRSLADQCSLALGTSLLSREAATKYKLDEELAVAREVQSILLPKTPPRIAGFQLAARNIPAGVVSGDYYDFIQINDEQLGVAVADVAGKGVPAALIVAMARSVLRANASQVSSPAAVLSIVNRILFPDMREDRFISMAYCVLQAGQAQVSMARAGHDAPLVYRAATGLIDVIQAPGIAVGIDDGEVFNQATRDFPVPLEEGDILLIYTDGISEALNAEGDEFGVERIKDAFREMAPQGATAVVDHVLKKAGDFVGDYHQSDDMTLVVLEKTADLAKGTES